MRVEAQTVLSARTHGSKPERTQMQVAKAIDANSHGPPLLSGGVIATMIAVLVGVATTSCGAPGTVAAQHKT
jgi:hypothetical protein